MSPKTMTRLVKIRSVADSERKIASQIRGERTHKKKLKGVKGLHGERFYLARQKNLKKLRASEAKLLKALTKNRDAQKMEASRAMTAKKHDNEIQDGYLTKTQMRDF